tara:strand:- start:2105 stop:2311 length:207 start_codon:yes stop_codon:yes gene_type:complete
MNPTIPEKKVVRKTLSQLTDYSLQLLIDAQKEKIKKEKPKKLQRVIERNKLLRLEEELKKRNVEQDRL